MDYRINPIAVEGFADADGVYVNRDGAWLGEWNPDTRRVDLYSDDGDYVPAPADWMDHIANPSEDAIGTREYRNRVADELGL